MEDKGKGKGKGKGKMEVSAEERPSKKRKTMIITLKEDSRKERGEESPKDWPIFFLTLQSDEMQAFFPSL